MKKYKLTQNTVHCVNLDQFLSTKQEEETVMHLVVDVANQVIIPIGREESIDSWFQKIIKKLKFIVDLARQWKLHPLFVCDAACKTSETKLKWRQRREKELEKCYRKIPYCADTMVCEVIMARSLNLVFDRRYNADDIIATLALMHPMSIILSRDTDYFRYDDNILANRVYYIDCGRTVKKLYHNDNSREPLQTIRMYLPHFCSHESELRKCVHEGKYIRGTVFPLAERDVSSSLHMATRDLRRLLYTGYVTEIFPIWNTNENKVEWIEDRVSPRSGNFPKSVKEIERTIHNNIPFVMNKNHERAIFIMAAELFSERYNTTLIEHIFKTSESKLVMSLKKQCVP